MRSEPLPESVLVGHVRRPHGVGGEVVVEVLTDVPDRFEAGRSVDLALTDGSRQRLPVTSVRQHRNVLLVRLGEVADRDAAERLRGARLEVPRAETPAAPDGSFYYYELVGCQCHDRALGELGSVVQVVEDGGGLLLELAQGDTKLLVPFVEEFLDRVDVAAGSIELNLPPGLVEICESRS